jgi:hypothetical protein
MGGRVVGGEDFQHWAVAGAGGERLRELVDVAELGPLPLAPRLELARVRLPTSSASVMSSPSMYRTM